MQEQIKKFVMVGIASTVLNYVVFSAMIFAQLNPLFSNATGYMSGLTLGFILNKKFTFNNKSSFLQSFPKYLFLYLISMVVGLIILNLLLPIMNVFIANLIVIAITTVLNFLSSKYLSFNDAYTLPQISFKTLFWVGLLIRVFCMYFFTNDMYSQEFSIATNYFAQTLFDPYIKYAHLFPYPPLMLYIFTPLSILTTSMFVQKIPILLFDILLIFTLSKMSKKQNVVLWFAWMNPVLIWLTYVHGQLDIIPMTLFVLSVLWLTEHRFLSSAIMYALAIATKHHLLLFYPLIIAYIYKQREHKQIVNHIFTTVITTLIVSLPFVLRNHFWTKVILNKEVGRITELAIQLGDYTVWVLPVIICLLSFIPFTVKRIGRITLIHFITILCIVFLTLLPMQPGWLMWYIFFLIILSSYHPRINYLVSFVLGSYMLVYIFDIPTMYSLMIVANLCALSYLVKIYIQHRNKYNTPFTIGVVGDSGSGKTTLTTVLQSILPNRQTTLIRGDDLHKWERGHQKWSEQTHLDPTSNNLYLGFKHAWKLRQGQSIQRRHYDHSTGTFTDPITYKPADHIIFEGLHEFFIPKMRSLCDLKIFMDIDEDLRTEWKIARDKEKRGYTEDKVRKQLQDRHGDSQNYIVPQKHYADHKVSYVPCESSYKTKVTCSLDVDLSDLQSILHDHNVEHTYTVSNTEQTIVHNNTISQQDVSEILIMFKRHPIIHLQNINSKIEDQSLGFLQVYFAYVLEHGTNN